MKETVSIPLMFPDRKIAEKIKRKIDEKHKGRNVRILSIEAGYYEITVDGLPLRSENSRTLGINIEDDDTPDK